MRRWTDVLLPVVLLTGAFGCASQQQRLVYRAEKRLYEADRVKAHVMSTMLPNRSELLDTAVYLYRSIVADFEGDIDANPSIERIVVTAQTNLAALEFDTGRIGPARLDYERVLDLASQSDDMRMNALYSAAHLADLMEEPTVALDLYKRFFDDYLSGDKPLAVASDHIDYLDTPLSLARLAEQLGDRDGRRTWLVRAQVFYRDVAERSSDFDVKRSARFGLANALVEDGQWDEALVVCAEIERLYPEPASQSECGVIEGRVYAEGKQDRARAGAAYSRVYERFPGTEAAPLAMLAHADLLMSSLSITEAVSVYTRVLSDYPGNTDACAQAEWQLAILAEDKGDWLEASLRFKAIARKYPGTRFAFESPLHLAQGYQRIGALDAMRGAYERAIAGYQKILRGQYPFLTKIEAEDYIERALTEQGDWQAVVDHLLQVSDRYPTFERFQFNYLRAAEICEHELGDGDRALRILQTCVMKFPGSEAAQEATQRLERVRSRGRAVDQGN